MSVAPARAGANPADLVARARDGDIGALARVLTELERASAAAPALLSAMAADLGHALVVGITGPPGAGKSTLVNAYTSVLRSRDQTVGVIAVDPSSPLSGGAILGDRLRMTDHTDDDGVFVRSVASRGHSGGLSPAAVRMIDALDASGKDIVIIETVGTGQAETDIASVADIRVVVSAPGLGDDIQAMKAGILEIADILVVNKADKEGADRTAQQLKAALALRTIVDHDTPILRTTATTGDGVDMLADAIAKISNTRGMDDARARRHRRARYLIASAAAEAIQRRIREDNSGEIDNLCDDVLAGTLSPQAAAGRLLGDFE